MRMLLTVQLPTAASNAAVKDGSILGAMQHIMDTLKPEAAYFAPRHGVRSAMFIFDMKDQTDIVPTVEAFWLNMEAQVELSPVMNFDDLKAGLARLPR